ncbi:DUF2061 domain-containing protein [Phaeobacter inhibens]|uniref:DUF2061 domain-containing protein n=1 Tax=Phaeobacter inhibens TaxID=221822 RepID=UPI000C99A60A|nr:DUF2061 domain-containing protein [Phaeobacter inhibens]AUQ53533.1 putative membrane protein [Phaeobacter inhibens]AUQ77549.1 putative membrane protein [Phaeobacter inhibens]AUR14708.1 putative membrane protein [Phaeobacter inhibens]UWR89370.1 DUF2061 domain-containing protein [Phaeobacter inhibens]UWR93253.1 DUF2061 domain-containing protein [Phaeobacter inhibens]
MDTRARSVVKAVIWNLLGLAMMAGVGWLLTGSFALGGTLALVNTCVGFLCYLLYERIWAGVRWGRRHV